MKGTTYKFGGSPPNSRERPFERVKKGTTYKSYGKPYLLAISKGHDIQSCSTAFDTAATSLQSALPLVFSVLSEGACRRRIGALRGSRSVLSIRSGDLNPARLSEPHHPDRAVAGCREPGATRASEFLTGFARRPGFGQHQRHSVRRSVRAFASSPLTTRSMAT